MKKFFLMAAASCAMLLTGCKSDSNVEPSGSDDRHDVKITLDLSIGSELETRSYEGRQLWSEQKLQQVNNVTVYVFKTVGTDKVYQSDLTIQVNGFNNTKPNGEESHSYVYETRLAEGEYTFLAVGRQGTATYDVKTGAKLSDFYLALKSDQNPAEVFAGVSENSYTVNSTTKTFSAKVEMRRVVAGVLSYFKNVPYQLPYKENAEAEAEMKVVSNVCVEVSLKGTETKLSDRSRKTQTNLISDANGWYKLINFNMLVEGKAPETGTGNVWTCQAVSSGKEYTKVANSFLAGAFLLPTTRVEGQSTMRVALYDEDGHLLKYYPVKCSGGTGHYSGQDFDIIYNNLYSLGKKLNNIKENDPQNPVPDVEDPIDLTKEDMITVSVVTDWDNIHDLDLTDPDEQNEAE